MLDMKSKAACFTGHRTLPEENLPEIAERLENALIALKMCIRDRPYVGTETVSWMCILGAAPFAALGFITYHGMTAEQFLWTWLRSELLEPKELKFESENTYYEALRGVIESHEKEALKHDAIH